MFKKISIPFIIGALGIGMLFYLVKSSKKEFLETKDDVRTVEKSLNVVEKISQAQILENYKSNLKPLLGRYNEIFAILESNNKNFIGSTSLSLFASGTVDSEMVNESEKITREVALLKSEVGSLLVPENFRNLHLKIVLSLSLLKNFLDTRSLSDMGKAASFYEEVKKESLDL